jgi:hypothetical protein
MTQDERSQIKKYFKKFPTRSVWMIIIGLPLLAAKFVGVIPIGLGIWGIFSYYQKPSDEQMDVWIQEDLQNLRTRALAKTGLDPSEIIAEPVMVYGPRFWNIGGSEVGIKKGKDGIVRFMPIGITVINFTSHQLLAYQCAVDLTTGNSLSESTDEYFYRDVVSVSTQSESLTLDGIDANAVANGPLAALLVGGKLQLNAAETFKLTTSGGTFIKVLLRDPKLIERAGGGSIPTDMADKAVQTVRKMLREKKIVAASA